MDIYSSFDYDYVCLPPSKQIGLHEGDSWELSYVIKGAGTRIIGEYSMQFGNGDLVLIPPRISHCWYFGKEETDESGKISNISIHFSDDFLDRASSVFPELSKSIDHIKEYSSAIAITGTQAAELVKIMRSMKWQSAERRIISFLELLIIIGKLHSFQTVGQRKELSQVEAKFNQVRVYVICNMDSHITLDEIAKHLGMSRSSFCSFIKKMSGQSFINYLNDIRLQKAMDLLQSTSLSVSEISARVGFGDVPYFNRSFRKKFGQSPQKFRNNSIE